VFRTVNRHDQVRDGRLTDQSVARIVKRAALRVGFDLAQYAGHSLRATLCGPASRQPRQQAALLSARL